MRTKSIISRRILVFMVLAFAGIGNSASEQLRPSEQTTTQEQTEVPIAGAQSMVRRIAVARSGYGELVSSSLSGENLLWDISLSELIATRERPIFSASRRGVQDVEQPRSESQPQLPGMPQITLVGAVSSEDDGIAIFLDESIKGIVRLKIGEAYLGWTLQAVQGRQATLKRDRETAVVEIPTLVAKQK